MSGLSVLQLSGDVETRIAVGIVASGGATAIAVSQPW
jgi:hypothetical protein